LIDPDSIRREPEIPEDLDLDANVTVAFEDLKRGITAADMVSDHVRFRTGTSDDGKIACYIEAEGDTDDVDLELTHEKLVAIDAAPDDGDSLFSSRLPQRISRSRFRKTPRSGSNWAKSIRSSCTTDTRRWATTPSLATAR